jgi:hypothetical protein
VDSDQFEETRARIAATQARIDRIDRALSALLHRFLWLLRVFIGGALVSLVKLLGFKDGFPGF